MTNNSFEILLVYQYARFKNYPGSWFASVLSVSLPSCQSFKMKSADFLKAVDSACRNVGFCTLMQEKADSLS
jgi:hypothetical protein